MILPSLSSLRGAPKKALADALAALEIQAGRPELAALLDEAAAAPRGHVLGLTGPPGVGKSTLINALLRRWREAGETVGIIAVDPSSMRTGGALLGDRARIVTEPGDRGTFIRSMAARDRLGGLSDQTIGAVALMRALFDRVLVETVGIGQSEADISHVADTVLLCVQPGSGDSLQFMKAGVMELPDVIAVTKADMGAPATRAKADLQGALALFSARAAWDVPVILVGAAAGQGMDDLNAALAAHAAHLAEGGRLDARRARQEAEWIGQAIRARFGWEGWSLASRWDTGPGGPFSREARLAEALSRRLRVES